MLELVMVVAIIGALAAMLVPLMDRNREDAESTVARVSLQAVAEAFAGSATQPGLLSDMRGVPGFKPENLRVHDLLSASRIGTDYPGSENHDPATRRGWRGPYLRSPVGASNTVPARSGKFPLAEDVRFGGDGTFLERGFYLDASQSPYGAEGDLTAGDPWGNPFVLQVPPDEAFAHSATSVKKLRYARVISAGPDGILSTPRDRLAGRLIDGTAALRGDDLVLFLNRSDVYEDEEP